jgi:uncharacterized OB-fold protein
VSDDLFEWPSESPALLAVTCDACGQVTFPRQDACGRCGKTEVTETTLSRHGTLWTWTRQRFQPKNPPYIGTEPANEFQGYGVGYVELPEGRLEARLVVGEEEPLEIGMPMTLCVVPFATDAEGNEVVTYAFTPGTGE